MSSASQKRAAMQWSRRWWIQCLSVVVVWQTARTLIASRSVSLGLRIGQEGISPSAADPSQDQALLGIQDGDDGHGRLRKPSTSDGPALMDGETTARVFGNTPGKDWPKIIDEFIDLYRDAANILIHVHTQSWNRMIANDVDARTDEQVEWDQRQDNLLKKFPYLEELGDGKAKLANETNLSSKVLEPLIWDREASIDRYFHALTKRCSRSINAIEDEDFIGNCWGTISELVKGPRCTVRLDSRYVCDGPQDRNESKDSDIDAWMEADTGKDASKDAGNTTNDDGAEPTAGSETQQSPASQMEPARQFTAEQVIQQHFTDDTLNIVIIGAGPVGLQLANVLNHLEIKDSIRILMFEKRVDHPGRKMAYSRDWCTFLAFNAFNKGDRRIVKFFDQLMVRNSERPDDEDVSKIDSTTDEYDVFDDDDHRKVNLALMIIETLLLISNRDLGVKFLYEDIRTHRHLLEDVPNLVVFDASGHRLDTMERSAVKPDTPPPTSLSSFTRKISAKSKTPSVTMADWAPDRSFLKADDEYPWYYLQNTDYPILKDLNFLAKVAIQTTAQGTIMYPVTSQGDPYRLRTMEFMDFRYARRRRGMFSAWHAYMRELMTSDHPLCNETHYNRINNFQSDDFCSLCFGWDTSVGYRPDVFEAMKDTRTTFSTMSAMFGITDDQYDLLSYIYQDRKNKGIPIRELPIPSMLPKSAFKKNSMAFMLLFFVSHSGLTYPLTSLYSYTPYIYSDVVVPPTAQTQARIGNAPLLRIGDTLSTGNSNLGSGLTQHMHIIERLGENLKEFKI